MRNSDWTRELKAKGYIISERLNSSQTWQRLSLTIKLTIFQSIEKQIAEYKQLYNINSIKFTLKFETIL